jgi:hypothetical protein
MFPRRHSQEYFPFPCRSTRDGPAAREVFDTPTTVAAPARVHRNPRVPLSPTLTVTHHLPSLIHRQNEPSPVGSTAHSPTSKSPFTEDRLASIVGKKTLRRENSRGSAGSLAALGMSDASASTSPYGSAAPSRRASVGDLSSSLGGGVDSGRLSPLSADGRVSPTGADSDADVTMNDIVDDRRRTSLGRASGASSVMSFASTVSAGGGGSRAKPANDSNRPSPEGSSRGSRGSPLWKVRSRSKRARDTLEVSRGCSG